jgi:hypothetical protein
MPAIGNHEYQTPDAAGYFGYFGSAAGDPALGYYAYDAGTWRVIVLNSECVHVGGCGAGSPQEQWLRGELATHPAANVLAIWHEPRFSSGAEHGSSLDTAAFWDALYEFGAELVLTGHEHVYERFAPQTPLGAADPSHGIREFIVGTGGTTLETFATPIANSEVRYSSTPGVLKLTLDASSYSWQYIPVSGGFTDSGTTPTHGPPEGLVTLPASDDARVRSSQPTKNFGADASLQIRSSQQTTFNSYLKFNVTGLSAPPVSVRLRLFVTDGGPAGGTLHDVADGWSESTINWNNAPAIGGSSIATLGTVPSGQWRELDITSYVTGNGIYSIGIKTTNGNSVIFSSSEGANPPHLVIDPS